jgi:nitric oxide dioxygenase
MHPSLNDSLASAPPEPGPDIALLESSFKMIAPCAEEFVDAFYAKLFELYPQTRSLFAATDMTLQRNKLISALVFVMENLRHPQVLSSALTELGRKHQSYQVSAEHYPMVGDALLKTFSAFLGDAWKPEIANAWVQAYGMITRAMLSGYSAPHAP